MNTDLIKITEKNGKSVVSAKTLYNELGFDSSNWAKWYRKNIVNNKFAIENEDWVKLVLSTRKCDFALTIGFAKKLSMIARTERGEIVRQYFVDCETRLKTASNLLQNDILVIQKAEIEELKEKVALIESKNLIDENMFTVKGYASYIGQYVDNKLASSIGRKSTAICRKENLNYSKIADPRFGNVGLYPIPVLKRVFKDAVVF